MKRRKGVTAQRRNGHKAISRICFAFKPLRRWVVEPLRPSIMYKNKGLR